MVQRSRTRPFDQDGPPPPTSNDDAATRAWRQRLAETARRAAEDIAKEDNRHLARLHADLIDLATRLTADNPPLEHDDPRRNT